MTTWYGWAGTILDVNLTTGEIKRVPLSRDFAVKYLGGTGFAARYLYDELKPGIDPLGPENIIMVTNGTLTGTSAPSCGRYDVVTKSPQTGIFLRTNGGGHFGPELKWAGYDLVIIRGVSPKPVYLSIFDDKVEIKDAGHIWGKDTWQTQELIRKDLGNRNVQCLVIGPSGENLGISSCLIANLGRAAGKGAPGAVWGSKKLKAVAVRGTRGVNIARPDEFLQACVSLKQRYEEDPVIEAVRLGSPRYVSDALALRGEYVPGVDMSHLASIEFETNYYERRSGGCFGCPVQCSHWYMDKSGPYEGSYGLGLEGNAVIFGGIVMHVNNPAFVCKFNTVCNQLGLHLDTPGQAMAWAMKLREAGILTKEDTDGIDLKWGNEEAILQMLPRIAYRQGFGEVLDCYPLRAAQKLGRGSEAYMEHSKGMTGHGSGILTSVEFTLGHGVSTRGYDHLIGSPSWPAKIGKVKGATKEVLGMLGEKLCGEPRLTSDPWYKSLRKALFVYDFENTSALCDIAGACKHASIRGLFTCGWDQETFAKFITLATGVNYGVPEVVKAAEREMLIERAFNAREGIRRIDDYPMVYNWQLKHGEPHPLYRGVNFPLTLEEYDQLLDTYYQHRGCDLKTGIPTREKLESLSLKDIADDLWKA